MTTSMCVINFLIAQLFVVALVLESSSFSCSSSSDKVYSSLAACLPARRLLGSLPLRIEIELFRIKIKGMAPLVLEVWRVNMERYWAIANSLLDIIGRTIG